MNQEIDIFKVLDYIRDNAEKYARAKANRVYLEEFRKSKKAMLMIEAERDLGLKTVASQEVAAYAHEDYRALLDALKIAVEEEEGYRWMLIAAQAKCEVFRTLQANQRVEAKVL